MLCEGRRPGLAFSIAGYFNVIMLSQHDKTPHGLEKTSLDALRGPGDAFAELLAQFALVIALPGRNVALFDGFSHGGFGFMDG